MSNKKNKPAAQDTNLRWSANDNTLPRDISKREYQTDKEGSPSAPVVGLQQIDEAILYYFDNVIKLSVEQNGSMIRVPVMYGSPERWSNVQKDGVLRDKNGKLHAPLVMFKRENLEKDRTLSNKLDSNNPSNLITVKNTYSKANIYDRFARLNNRVPKTEYYAAVVPDYVTVTYRCVVFTDYIHQMNKIIEAVNYAEDSYWGDKAKFMFRSYVDSFGTSVDVQVGQDRVVRTEFTLRIRGYVTPSNLQADMNNFRKQFSKSQFIVKFETAGTLEELTMRAAQPTEQSGRRFFDGASSTTGATNPGMTTAQILYTTLNNSKIAEVVTTNTATFQNATIAEAPAGFTATSKKDFTLYINGQLVPDVQVTSLTQVGDDIVATFDTVGLQYELLPSFEVVIVGKFNTL